MRFNGLKAYLKYKLGFTAGLPAFVINGVKECENNEPLVDIKNADVVLFFGDRLKNEKQVLLRKSVAEKIVNASKKLPKDVFFIIYDAFRSLEHQQSLWNKKYEYFKNMYPSETEDQITARTKRVVADPRRGHGGHQTGGAIDIGLCDQNVVELDMGAPYSGTGQAIRTKSEVNEEAKRNRKILCDLMKNYGFVNYPNEWWHFCYGDRMWAAYSMKKNCCYGLVTNQKFDPKTSVLLSKEAARSRS